VSAGPTRAEGRESPAGTGASSTYPVIARRVLPFAIAAALPFLLTLLFGPSAGSAGFITSAVLTLVLTVAAFTVPWPRVPVSLRAAVPLTYFVVVFLLRNSSGASAAVYTPLVLLPVIWLALYGTRAQLIVAFLLLALTLIVPILVFGAPRYPSPEWRRVAIYLVIAPIVGFTIQWLVVTTRERADRLRASEQALRESEARHRLLVQNLPDTLMSLYDRERRLLLVEGPMLARLGFASEDLVGRTLPEITPAEELGELEPLYRAALGGESTVIEHESPRQGVVYDLQVAPYRDDAGKIVGVFSVARDITERKRVEAQAQAAETQFATAYEHAPTGMGLLSPEGRFISVNPALCALTGYTRDELLGRSLAAITHPEDHEPSDRLMRSLVAGERDSYDVESRYVHADGHPIDVSLHVALVRDSDGKPLHSVGQVLDITERKRQATLRERELALTHQARQQLAEQYARLVEIDRMKDDLVALVSHELRTPLTSITGYLEPILDREAGPLTPTQERFLKTIERNAHALSTIVGDLLFLATVDAGKLTLHAEDVDMAELVAEAVEACAPSADRRGIAVIVDAAGVPTVRGDRARLAQLTDNLLSNAIKFTPDGGHVEVRGREDASNAVIEIRDTGIGIPADEIPRLFARFYRATSAIEHAISGTGLGLAIVKSIADAHHGAIEVDSSPGVGTTMRLLLPLV
jgi:PAS domain S-box-containing protein